VDDADDAIDIGDALRRLPRRQREVLVLRDVLGYSEGEVALHLGVALGTVKTHLRRGHVAMRGLLTEPPEQSFVP
jgi:DNA-directed RNA polymerase specialized sigma24 family protein